MLSVGTLTWAFLQPIWTIRVAAMMGLAGLMVATAVTWRTDARGVVARALGLEGGSARPDEPAWSIVGLVLLVGVFALLQLREPFYFTENDNYATEVPALLQMCRSWANGVWPWWSPYQFGGVPTGSWGTIGFTYPPAYASYLVARDVLGNELAIFEVFAFGHLLVGYLLARKALRNAGQSPVLATLGAVTWCTSGYLLIAGRSWHFHMPLVAFLPATTLALQWLERRGGSVGWFVVTGAVLGLAEHAVSSQLWAYIGLFYGLGLLGRWGSAAIGWREVAWGGCAGILGVAFAAPVLLLQLQEFAGIERVGAWGNGIGRGLFAMVLPWPIVWAPHPQDWGSAHLEWTGVIYDGGALPTGAAWFGWVLLIAALLAWRISGDGARALAGRNLELIVGGIAFVLALGYEAPLWTLLSLVPPFTGMNSPYKFLPFVHWYFALGGGLVLTRLAAGSRRWERALVAIGVPLLVWRACIALASHYSYPDRPPYPDLPAVLAPTTSADVRTIAIAPDRNVQPGFVFSLKNSWATFYGVQTLDNYRDQMVEIRPEVRGMRERLAAEPVEAARAWGVKWLWIHRTAQEESLGPNRLHWSWERVRPDDVAIADALSPTAIAHTSDSHGTLYELSDPGPMAFFASDDPLVFRTDGAGVHVDVNGRSGRLVVAYLWWPWMSAADGRGQTFFMTADEWGRMVVDIPPAVETVHLTYQAPWKAAVAKSMGLAGIALLGVGVLTLATRRQ